MTLSIRIAEVADLDTLDPMVADYHAFEEIDLEPDRRRAAVIALLTTPELGRIYVIERGQRVIGYAALTFGFSIELGGRDAFIDELFIVEDFRGQGAGAEALAHALEAAKMEGVGAVHLEVAHDNGKAKALYRRLGFAARERFHLMTKRF